MLHMRLEKNYLAASITVTCFCSISAYRSLKSVLFLVFANAGIVERPWLPNFDPATAADRPIIKPDLTTLNIDLIGQLYTAALALQALERQSTNKHGFKGKLLMTASVYGFFPSAIMPMYASAKAGIVNFTRSAAIMYAEKGITINTSECLSTTERSGTYRSTVAPSMAGEFLNIDIQCVRT